MSQNPQKKLKRKAVKKSIVGESKAGLADAVIHRDFNTIGKFLLETMSKAEIKDVMVKYNDNADADEERVKCKVDLCEEVYTELGRLTVKLLEQSGKLFQSKATAHFTKKCIDLSYKLYKLDN